MDKLLKYGNKFNSHVKFLSRIYVNNKRGKYDEEQALRNKKRLSILIAEYPLFLIKTLGPYLLKYGELISEGKWEEFYKKNYSEEIKHYNAEAKEKKTETVSNEEVKENIAFIKKVYESSSEEEKSIVSDVISDMLSLYCQYAKKIKSDNL